MSSLLARLFLLAMLVAITPLTMIYGWGLQPKSWGWIIGFGFFANVAVMMLNHLLEREEKK